MDFVTDLPESMASGFTWILVNSGLTDKDGILLTVTEGYGLAAIGPALL